MRLKRGKNRVGAKLLSQSIRRLLRRNTQFGSCMFDKETRAALNETVELWDRAERNIKRAERVSGEVVFPAINELRYAGRRLIDAFRVANKTEGEKTAEDRRDFHSYIFDVKQNCIRAEHDVIDAIVLFVHQRIELLQKEYGPSITHQYFPKLAELQGKMRNVDDIVIESRGNRQDRQEEYARIGDEYLDEIIALYRDMQQSEKAIGAAITEAERRDRNSGIINGVSIFFGIAGFAVGLISIL